MFFHTYTFAIFFVVTFIGYLLLKKSKMVMPWLLFTSYFFYGWWNPLYLLLILYSTVLDYLVVARMKKSQRKLFWLWISLSNNLLLLGFFKYGGFVTENINFMFTSFGTSYQLSAPDVLLPVGISFYTFQSLSYTIDFYRGHIKAEKNFIRFATFVSFFPQLVAGPIERASHLLPQFQSEQKVNWVNISDGISLFLVGLFKKIALADFFALYVNKIYDNPGDYSGASLLYATYAFAWQIYFDFSAYSDMARGIARIMGYDLMVNFNHPYLATGFREFWQRWHISLSTWFRDYVYIPLGGSRVTVSRVYRNLFITMVVSGVWHGASWNFIIWGALNAIALCMMMEIEFLTWYKKIPTFFKQVWVFHFICFTWIFFRARDFTEASLIIQKIYAGFLDNHDLPIFMAIVMLLLWGYQNLTEMPMKKLINNNPMKILIFTGMILYLLLFAKASGGQFIYFQF